MVKGQRVRLAHAYTHMGTTYPKGTSGIVVDLEPENYLMVKFFWCEERTSRRFNPHTRRIEPYQGRTSAVLFSLKPEHLTLDVPPGYPVLTHSN